MANKKLKKFLEQQKLQYFPNPLDLEWSIGLHTDYLNVDILSEAYLNGYYTDNIRRFEC